MKHILPLFALAVALGGCGPEQSTKDKEDAQIAANEKSAREALAPAAGVYRGRFTTLNGDIMEARLTLAQIDVPQRNPGRSQDTFVPTSLGALEVCISSAGCFDSTDATNVLVIGQISSARYYADTGRLVLFFEQSLDVTHGGALAKQFDGVLKGERLTGKLSTSMRPNSATIDLRRISKMAN